MQDLAVRIWRRSVGWTADMLDLTMIPNTNTIFIRAKHKKTLDLIFSRPTPASVKWADAVGLLKALGAEISEREGSRVAFYLFGQISVMHRPHPTPELDKGAAAALRRWLEDNGVKP